MALLKEKQPFPSFYISVKKCNITRLVEAELQLALQSEKSATMRESNYGSGVCKEHYM